MLNPLEPAAGAAATKLKPPADTAELDAAVAAAAAPEEKTDMTAAF